MSQTCSELLAAFPGRERTRQGARLDIRLAEGDGRDVYNISAPFQLDGGEYLLGRVEARDSEQAQTLFFRRAGDAWEPDPGYPALPLQDPFHAVAGGSRIIGGVETFPDPADPEKLSYRTLFYRLEGKRTVFIGRGPDKMKDIRLLELSPGRLLVFTRPQGNPGGRGTIGWKILDSLGGLTPGNLSRATLLTDQFVPEEWGGANEAHRLANGRVGVLSHIARFDPEGCRHYYASCFAFDPQSGTHSPMKLIAARGNLKPGDSKRPDLRDVLFSSGLIRRPDGTAVLYCGAGDAEAHCLDIPDPFLEWERAPGGAFDSEGSTAGQGTSFVK